MPVDFQSSLASLLRSFAMVASAVQLAKRALVSLLLTLAQQYSVQIQLKREDDDNLVEAAFRKVVKKTHPDKGGKLADQQRLQSTRERWRALKTARPTDRARPKVSSDLLPVQVAEPSGSKPYFIMSSSVLLTYHNVEASAWDSFIDFLQGRLLFWGVLHWCASMEECHSGRPHIHIMFQFLSASKKRQANDFAFGDSRPNASSSDLCGEGLCRKQLQRSIDRGFFYVYANKYGTLRMKGDYLPCWTESVKKYQVLGKWPETLWKQRKISSEEYERLLFLSRDGVVARSRNLQACREHERAVAAHSAIDARVKRIRGNPSIYQPFPSFPEAKAWLELFKNDALRYPILVVLGASRTGKTEWAKSLFKKPLELKIGALQFFPDGLRRFCRNSHDGLVLDDVRDLQFIVDNQDKLQGKYDCLVEFGSTAGGTCAYHLDLYGVPVVVTINFSTKNLQYLESHDWLSNPGNRVLVQFPAPTVPN